MQDVEEQITHLRYLRIVIQKFDYLNLKENPMSLFSFSDTPSSPAAVNGQAAQPAADQPLPSTTAGNGDAAEKPSVQVQTEIKLFPGILSKN